MSKVILLRHGRSEWDAANRFTGWIDIPLSEQGVMEAHQAARLIIEAGLRPRVLHTSLLRRAVQTGDVLAEEIGVPWESIGRSWRLNERHYGALQGVNRRVALTIYGDIHLNAWRRGYDSAPPPAFGMCPDQGMPVTESLRDVVSRLVPYWHDSIVPDIRRTGLAMVIGHSNSLRALMKLICEISDRDVEDLNVPTGVPVVLELDRDLKCCGTRYLGDPDDIAARARAIAALTRGSV